MDSHQGYDKAFTSHIGRDLWTGCQALGLVLIIVVIIVLLLSGGG
jgi:hypothetical protein